MNYENGNISNYILHLCKIPIHLQAHYFVSQNPFDIEKKF